jgi:hypothetical protein
LPKSRKKELIAIESSECERSQIVRAFCNGNAAIHNLTKEIVEKKRNIILTKFLQK